MTGLVQECYARTAELLAHDPFALEVMDIHLTAALELHKKNELFLRAHRCSIQHTSLLFTPDFASLRETAAIFSCLDWPVRIKLYTEQVLIPGKGKQHPCRGCQLISMP